MWRWRWRWVLATVIVLVCFCFVLFLSFRAREERKEGRKEETKKILVLLFRASDYMCVSAGYTGFRVRGGGDWLREYGQLGNIIK